MSGFGGSVHRLQGSSGNEVGGLIIKKKPQPQGDDVKEAGKKGSKWDKKPAELKAPAPRASMFGLDVLAKRKREEREAEEEAKFGEKRLKVTRGVVGRSSSNLDSEFSDDGSRVSFGRSTEKQKDRLYRQMRVETPSHTGGVNEAVLDKIQQRLKKERSFAVGAKSRDIDKERR